MNRKPRARLGWALLVLCFALLLLSPAGFGEEKKEGEPAPPPPDPFAERQVFIEVLVVETTYDDAETSGVIHEYLQRVNGELRSAPYSDDPAGDRGDVRPSVINFPNLPNADAGLQLVGTTDLETGVLRSTIQSLIESGKARILSKPSILVLNAQTGEIKAGEQIPFLQRVLGQKDTVLVTSHKDTGITLKVTPTIYNERIGYGGAGANPEASDAEVAQWSRYVVMEVEANDYVLTRYRKEASTPMPIFDVRKQNTTVVVESGKTFVMGGLLRQRESKVVNGVPVLADIPAIGRAFSNHDDSIVTRELSITITPTIVADELALSEQVDRTLDLTQQITAEQQRNEKIASSPGSIDEKLAEKRKKK